MRGYVRHVVRGFAFGLGFAAALGLGWLAVHDAQRLAGEVGSMVAGAPAARPLAAPSRDLAQAESVRVVSHRVERRNGDAVVLGTLRNEGEATVRSVRVETAYYDAGGRLADLCGWYVAIGVVPGEERPFKVSCGGTPERPAPDSASVRVRVTEGF